MQERYWTFVCENKTKKKNWIQKLFGYKDKTTDAIIFGVNKLGLYGQPNKNIEVSCSESSHAQVRAEILHKPVIAYLKSYFTKTERQLLTQIICFSQEDKDENVVKMPFRPLVHKTSSQFDKKSIFIPDGAYKINIHGGTEICIPLLPEEIITMIFKIDNN